MSIGRILACELRESHDPGSGRRVRQFTSGSGHSYPLYYFTPCVTMNNRFMVIHRVQDGWLNLWRLDLAGGGLVQLTDGHTRDAGWAIWGEMDVQGVYDHLSALNRDSSEVWYFDGTGLFATHVETLRQRQVWDLGDRICISQNDFSPDGKFFIFVHADRDHYLDAVARHTWTAHEAWRNSVPCVVGCIDVATGGYRVVAELPFHVHHAVFVDPASVLLNHIQGGLGMWRMGLDGRNLGVMRPADGHGATCHQSVTRDGIWYETINWGAIPRTWLGRYDLQRNDWQEFAVPQDGYVHVGHDPAGQAAFYEIDGLRHELMCVHEPFADQQRRFETLCTLEPYPPHTGGQRYHAHPFLAPTRDWVYHTRVVSGTSQVAALEFGERLSLRYSPYIVKGVGDVFHKLTTFIATHQTGAPDRYRYAAGSTQTTLYSSTYAAMARHLLGELDALTVGDRAQWIAYLQAHQDDDGLFRDPVIFNQGWYKDDPLWCGRPHLTCHVIAALACLGGTAEKPLRWLDPWRDVDGLVRWLEARDWGEQVAWTGNEIMNVGVLLQYARDFQNDTRAGNAAAVLLEWLATHHINPATGVWGAVDTGDPKWRSHAVQAAYHWWPLFFYDGVRPPHIERAIDTVLATQNPLGGFGCGVHNAAEPFMSSACEDIDSIDPLCRMMQLTGYLRADIEAALAKAADWVLTNQMPDGGFVFIRNQPFEYGHAQMRGEAGQGAMFPTWFRFLSLALIGKALPGHPLGRVPWRFVRCPGMQFWGERVEGIERIESAD